MYEPHPACVLVAPIHLDYITVTDLAVPGRQKRLCVLHLYRFTDECTPFVISRRMCCHQVLSSTASSLNADFH